MTLEIASPIIVVFDKSASVILDDITSFRGDGIVQYERGRVYGGWKLDGPWGDYRIIKTPFSQNAFPKSQSKPAGGLLQESSAGFDKQYPKILRIVQRSRKCMNARQRRNQ